MLAIERHMWDCFGEAFLRTLATTTSMFLAKPFTGCDHKIGLRDHNVNSQKASLTVCQFPVPKLDMFRGFTVPSTIRLLLGVERSATTINPPSNGGLANAGAWKQAGKRLAIDKRHCVDTEQEGRDFFCVSGGS